VGKIEERLNELGIKLPEAINPEAYNANFVPVSRHGDFLYVSGSAGRHARSAIGTSALPMRIAVEVEMLVVVE